MLDSAQQRVSLVDEAMSGLIKHWDPAVLEVLLERVAKLLGATNKGLALLLNGLGANKPASG